MTAATVPPVHDLLLALAGRLDDDLLAWARELLAVGEEDQAVELATAALAAERVVLPPTLRDALVAAARAAHTDLDAATALAAGAVEEGTRHRFDAAAASGDAVRAVLTALPARRLTGCTLHLTWRRTPAGAAPGPLPRAVVLVEADPDRSADVLAYLLATELERAGVPASVEVFTAGRPLPAYHAAALRNARTVLRGTAEQPQASASGAPEGTPLFLVSGRPSGPTEPTDEQPEAAPSGTTSAPPEDAPSGAPARPGGRRRRPEPDAGVPSDGGVSEPAAPAGPPSPPAGAPPVPHRPDAGGSSSPPAGRPPVPHRPDADERPPDTDPLNGPLRVPLLAPLLDPTGADPNALRPAGPAAPAPDPAATGSTLGLPLPAERRPSADSEQAPPAEPASPPDGPAPEAPGPAAVPPEWEEDWRSGEWAMPHTPRPGPAADRPGPDGAFDVFGAPVRSDPPNLPRRTERHHDDPGAVPPARPDAPPAGPDGAWLFDSPTARVTPGSRPGPPVEEGRRTGAPAESGQHPDGRAPGPPFPSVAGPTPPDRPARPRGDRPAADDPIFGLGTPDVPLFGGRAPDVPLFGGASEPGGPAPEPPRPGRRRRPEPPPESSAPFPGAGPGHVPSPSRPADEQMPPALLEGTEGDLLAQLQAELAARERRPRPYRRAERNGSTHTLNGHGHGSDGDRPPPDLAS